MELKTVASLIASEFAHSPTVAATAIASVAVAALVGRWWTLLLPAALIAAVLGAGFSDSFYKSVPEDIQAGVVFGAVIGLVGGVVAVRARQARKNGQPPGDIADPS